MRRRALLKGAAAMAAVPAGALLGQSAAAADAGYYVATCEQYKNRILVYPSNVEWGGAKRWIFSPGIADGWWNLDDVKFRLTSAFGWVALVTASGGRAGMVQLTGDVHAGLGDVLWSDMPGGNPHAAELIPGNGSIAVASSGGYLSLYAPTAINDPSTLALVQTIPYPGAHGVLWDPTYSKLWAVGRGRATPFTVTGTDRDTRLSANDGHVSLGTYIGKDGGSYENLGHDLQPDHSDSTRKTLLVTHTTGVVTINTETMAEPTKIYPDTSVKSYVRHPSGEAFWVRGTGLTYHGDNRNWVSPYVQFFDASGAKSFTRSLPYGAEFYKARLWSTDFE